MTNLALTLIIASNFFIAAFMIRKWFLIKKKIENSILFMLFPCYQIILLLLYFNNLKKLSIQNLIVGAFIVLLNISINFVITQFWNDNEKRLLMEIQLHTLQNERQAELEYYELWEKQLEELRLIRHDFSNQLQTAYRMIEEGNNQEQITELLDAIGRKLHHE